MTYEDFKKNYPDIDEDELMLCYNSGFFYRMFKDFEELEYERAIRDRKKKGRKRERVSDQS